MMLHALKHIRHTIARFIFQINHNALSPIPYPIPHVPNRVQTTQIFAQNRPDLPRALLYLAVTIMSTEKTLGQRLQALHSQAKNIEAVVDLSKLSMSELEQLTVQFGEKHRNKTFGQVWKEDPQWIQFFANKYEQSTKPVHVNLLYFIRRKVERAERTGQEEERIPTYPKTTGQGYGKNSQAKAKAKSVPKSSNLEVETANSDVSSSDLEIIEENYIPHESIKFTQIEDRMGRLEEVLNQVIVQLSNITPQ